MGITLNSTTANNSDWKTIFQFSDADTGDLIDFTGADIQVEVKDFDGCLRVEATTGNGKIVITDTGTFELTVPVGEMQNLCAGAYKVGGVYSLNGETISLFTGSLSIIDGVARL